MLGTRFLCSAWLPRVLWCPVTWPVQWIKERHGSWAHELWLWVNDPRNTLYDHDLCLYNYISTIHWYGLLNFIKGNVEELINIDLWWLFFSICSVFIILPITYYYYCCHRYRRYYHRSFHEFHNTDGLWWMISSW